MAFIIDETREVYGVTLPNIYCRITPHVELNGRMYVSPMLYASKPAYKKNQSLNCGFDVVEIKQKYSEVTGLPIEERIETPASNKDLTQEKVFVGMFEDASVNYMEMCNERMIEHLIRIKFISDRANVVLEVSNPTS